MSANGEDQLVAARRAQCGKTGSRKRFGTTSYAEVVRGVMTATSRVA
jgi:hypothetical protein